MKKLLALVLALVMVMSLCITSNAAYDDAADVDYKEAVDVMTAIGVFNGDENGKFNPDGILTREQAAKIIAYMLLGKTAADSLSTAAAPFADVAADRWSAGAIAYCASEGIIAGVGNNNFDPTGKLTGYAFAKMCLVALGYSPKIEGFTDSEWAINVAKLAINANLTKKLSNVVLSKEMTREQAAQMAFNTEKAILVQYDGAVDVKTNDTSITVGATRSNVTYKVGGLEYDKYFAEQYCELLDPNPAEDDFGRPATEWRYKDVVVGTYVSDEPAYTYTAAVKEKDLYKTLSKTVCTDYDFNTYLNGYSADGDEAAPRSATTTAYAGTGAGVTTEVYVNDYTEDVVVVCIEPVIAQITKVNANSVTFKYGVALGTPKVVSKDDDFFAELSAMKVDDYFAAVMHNTTLKALQTVTKLTSNATKYTSKTDAYTVDGTDYVVSKNATQEPVVGTTKYDIYLSENNCILYSEATETAADEHLFVLNWAIDGNAKAGYNYMLKVVKADGVVEWIEVGQVNDSTTEADIAAMCADGKLNKFFAYAELSDGTYKIADLAAGLTSGAKKATESITKEDKTIDGKTTTNATKYVVANSSGNYTAYTGYKAMPAAEVTDTGSKGGMYILYDTNSVAKMVVIKQIDGAVATDYFFVTASAYTSYVVEKQTVYCYEAFVNGEATTIEVKSGLSPVIGTVYFGYTLKDGYVSNLGTAYAYADAVALSNAASSLTDASDKVVLDATTAKLKLADGVLTATDGTDTKLGYTAEGFKAYSFSNITDDANKGVVIEETLSDDTAKLFDDVDTGDFIVVLTDKDSEVTAVFFMNVADN